MPVVVLVILVAAPILAQCPHDIGTFSTYDGTLHEGRTAVAWCVGVPFEPGNDVNSQSWDGVVLGSQWIVFGMAIDYDGGVLVDSDIDENGNGWEDWLINYDGGEFWFSKDHTWGDGISDLHGLVDMYHSFVTVTYVDGNLVGQTANISWNGRFLNCPEINNCVVEFTIANSMLVWWSDLGLPRPANYPGMLCSEGLGELHDMCCITMSLDCAIATEEISWSTAKVTY